MITRKSRREIDAMKESGAFLASIHEQLRDFIKPGITGRDIDHFVEKLITEKGAIPAQIGYQGYEYATCISVNDEICHGFPTEEVLKNGDLVKVDMVIDLNGAYSDSAWAYVVGEGSQEVKDLMDATREALYKGDRKSTRLNSSH